LDLGLDQEDFNEEREIPEGWRLRWAVGKRGSAQWVVAEGVAAAKLYSDAALKFLGKNYERNLREDFKRRQASSQI
jgi:hypothetical protein